MARMNLPLFGLILVAAFSSCEEKAERTSPPAPAPTMPKSELTRAVEKLEAEAFTDEKEARHFENNGIVPHWDRFLAAPVSKRLQAFSEFPFESLRLGVASAPKALDLDITEVLLSEGGETLDRKQWRNLLKEYQTKGYALEHSDWHHAAFQRNEKGVAISEVTFTLQGRRGEGKDVDRLQVKGTLRIVWDESGKNPTPKEVILLSGNILKRHGADAFVLKETYEGSPSSGSRRGMMGSINVRDVDGDGYPEIILGRKNTILWNKGGFRFEAGPLYPPGSANYKTPMSLVADFNGDGVMDWLFAVKAGHLGIHFGKLGAGFQAPAYKIELGDYKLKSPSCITAGDIDGDGDLDLFIGQWRKLYEKVPSKFWDANDGYGNTLLINNGRGEFSDGTKEAGLQEKRFRRTYSASFLDLDDDQDLDLLVVSDFCGIDVYHNDGHGHFTDVTAQTIDNAHSFGMSHTVADYNLDGKLDFYILGMGSTTARRLERMKANPKQFSEANKMRPEMGYGNRMYLNQGSGEFKQPSFRDQVARTGWAWGSTSFDFDNDGDQDIYAANGHLSGKTTQDYCTNFWCRDIYAMAGRKQTEINSYLLTIPEIKKQSWDGYQVNPLLVNQGGEGFKGFSYMLDVGIDSDCRRVISADLDLDGRVDLLIGRMASATVFFHDASNPGTLPALLVYRNILPQASKRHWIGVTLHGVPRTSPFGAVISVKTAKGEQRGTFVSGDLFSAQHPSQKHFGLGGEETVENITILWANGKKTTLENPKVDTYHTIYAPF